MRTLILLACTTTLAACGGAGPQTAGSAPPPSSSAPTPADPGTGGNNGTHTFVNPTEPKTYKAVGGSHSYEYEINAAGQPGARQISQLYQGDATTVRNTDLTIAYNPRDAIFNVSFRNGLAGTDAEARYQDPVHRTDFGGALEPQMGTPNLGSTLWNLPNINYLEGRFQSNVFFEDQDELILGLIDPDKSGSYESTTFFYQTPGTETNYVTFAGYLRNSATVKTIEVDNPDGTTSEFTNQVNDLERGAFAFGEITANGSVPTTGTGSYEGTMLASMVFNDQPDTTGSLDTYFQWIVGRATTDVDFGASTFALSLDGKVGAPIFDGTSGQHTIRADAQFLANGSGQIDLIAAGGFFGQFQDAWFVNPDGNRFDLLVAGSSIDGAFYGPNGEEVGGGFRIVGGTPDERIDIMGTFVGVEK